MRKITLIPKTHKGKNKRREAKTNIWVVIREGEFQNIPALLIYPEDNINKIRWVFINNDPDFEIGQEE